MDENSALFLPILRDLFEAGTLIPHPAMAVV
jgi:hypothetical protein